MIPRSLEVDAMAKKPDILNAAVAVVTVLTDAEAPGYTKQ
jgi:hypothetical protein